MQLFLDFLLPVSITVIMLGIGMELTASDFKRIFIEPKAILFGLFGQLVLMLLVAFGIALVFPLEPIHQLGIILIAVCPGGTSSNIVSYMLKGRVALSVSITAFNSLLVIFTIPLVLNFSLSLFMNDELPAAYSILPIYSIFSEVVLTVLIPVIIGIIIRHNFPEFVNKIKKYLRYILPGILFVIFTLVLINEQQNDSSESVLSANLLFPALSLNVLVMLIGFFLAGAIGINHTGKYTIAIEMGLQNSAMAIFLANNVLKIDGLSLIAVIYGSFSFFSTLLIAYLLKKYGKPKFRTFADK